MWTTTKRCLLRCIATLCVATVFLVRAEDADAPFATQLAKLIAADGAANDNFGHSVAISDGIAVVGAHNDDDKGAKFWFRVRLRDERFFRRDLVDASGETHRRRRSSR